jgi:hypothetical protein
MEPLHPPAGAVDSVRERRGLPADDGLERYTGRRQPQDGDKNENLDSHAFLLWTHGTIGARPIDFVSLSPVVQ